MGGLLSHLRSLFFSRQLEVVLVGLANSGKTTFSNQLHSGEFVEEGPTVGLNVRVLKKGGVTMKVWDLGGQQRYRAEWARYSRGSDVIVFVVDTQAPDDLPVARRELHMLLEDRDLAHLPLLVLANKIDLGPKFRSSDTTDQRCTGAKTSASASACSWSASAASTGSAQKRLSGLPLSQ